MSCNCNSENKSCLDIVPIFSSLNEEEQIKVSMITDSRQYKKDEIILTASLVMTKLYDEDIQEVIDDYSYKYSSNLYANIVLSYL